MSSKAEKEIIKVLLKKHQRKHPGCKLNEKRCKVGLSDKCLVKADKSKFHVTSSTCKPCLIIVNRNYYERVTIKKREKTKKQKDRERK